MSSGRLRGAALYTDAEGWSEVDEQMRWIARSNPRGAKAIATKIEYLCAHAFDRALGSGLIK